MSALVPLNRSSYSCWKPVVSRSASSSRQGVENSGNRAAMSRQAARSEKKRVTQLYRIQSLKILVRMYFDPLSQHVLKKHFFFLPVLDSLLDRQHIAKVANQSRSHQLSMLETECIECILSIRRFRIDEEPALWTSAEAVDQPVIPIRALAHVSDGEEGSVRRVDHGRLRLSLEREMISSGVGPSKFALLDALHPGGKAEVCPVRVDETGREIRRVALRQPGELQLKILP